MQEWSKINKGYKYMLNVIDVYSKYVWSVPLKEKKGETVTDAFKLIIKNSGRKPRHIWVDQGKEFYNKNMDQWLEENIINRYNTYGEHKSCVVERVNRTLKEKMWKTFTAENNRDWVDMLDRLINEYNNTVRSTTGMTPVKCSKLKSFGMKPTTDKGLKKSKFKVGDKIRLSRIKGIFEKGYFPNWSEAVYVIHEVKRTRPKTYILKEMDGEVLEGSFYEQELQKKQSKKYIGLRKY